MKDRCITLVSDMNYLQHTKYLFSALKFIGKWNEEFCLIANDVDDHILEEFLQKGIHIVKLKPYVNPLFAKLYLFCVYFKQWKKVCYFDTDFVILDDINKLVNIYNDDWLMNNSQDFLADIEPFSIHEYFDKTINPDKFEKLKSMIDVNKKGFNTGCMIYNTSIIDGENTANELFNLKNIFKDINNHTGLPEGTDQPILNIKFNSICHQIKGVNFHRNVDMNTIAMHTCRWEAPWKDPRYIDQYNYFLGLWPQF